MASRSKIKMGEQISAEACAWVAQLESGNLSRADIAALKEWVSRSPAHASEIQAIASLSGQLSELTECMSFVGQARRDNKIIRRRAPLISAFAAIVALIGILSFSYSVLNNPPTETLQLATLTGEYETYTLSDGSVVNLNTSSRLEVEFSKKMRRIRLISGEALFDVVSDPNRPFIVYAGSSESEALGTSFSVKLHNHIAELSVLEGVVSFSHNTIKSAQDSERLLRQKVVLNAGQGIALDIDSPQDVTLSAARIETIPEREMLRRISWTEGLLEFSDTPFREVIQEVNRHIRSPLRIGDERLYEKRIGGIYRAGDKEAMLEAFERLGVDVDRTNPNDIVLRLNSESEDAQ
jgi:transmembrane sensor